MRIALTGSGGLVGRFIADGLRGAGHDVVTLGRGRDREWYLLGPAPDLSRIDALVHAALDHVPGRYRGGEGDDPEGFIAANVDGTACLFEAAASSGVEVALFLSSRAVFDGYPPGTDLREDLAARPTSLYGKVKAQAEEHLFRLPLRSVSLRATGIYGPGPGHKWQQLFRDYLGGREIAPRKGTELHGADLAEAVRLCLEKDVSGAVHASDLVLDRHDLLAEVQLLTGATATPPDRDARCVSVLDCASLAALGWTPGGWDRLRADLPLMLPS
ncbi:Nucleoside-diphosphate-sugar epimerase [Roseivivax halotolerans]|uniref:Nucleoside-diphosphate-sugar epimerase n=1 Tax=Roseivivax halotolerans TaxID=93684 RepID=A0A1I5ZK07_9RHOB|nr:NAD(P)-dependent oxidoreductase [Roseivivax halotolerans]SFQ56703.1 Nucleoside-diphosphate-sugar epimerase [Roseivivax halotolerans]